MTNGLSLDVFVRNLDVVGCHNLLLDELPGQVLHHLGEVLVQLLGIALLILRKEPLLEAFLGELERADLVDQSLAGIHAELIVAAALVLQSNLSGNGLAELLLGGALLAKHLLEELLVELSRLVVVDLGDGEAEVRSEASNLLLLLAEQRSELILVVVVGSSGIEVNARELLGTLKLGLLLVALHIAGINGSALVEDTILLDVAIGVKFSDVTLDDVILGSRIGIGVFAILGLITLDLVVNHLVGHLDVVVGNLHALVNGECEFGSNGDVEAYGEVLLVGEINRLLILRYHRLAQDVEFIVGNILVHRIVDQPVHLIDDNLGTIHSLDEVGRNHTLAETRHLYLLASLLDLLLNCFCVVSLLNIEAEDDIYVIYDFLCNIHC